jgi:hypothetical protein
LNFGEQQERDDDRIGYVRRQVQLQGIETEQPAGEQAQRQMKPEGGRTADECAEAERRGLSCWRVAAGA